MVPTIANSGENQKTSSAEGIQICASKELINPRSASTLRDVFSVSLAQPIAKALRSGMIVRPRAIYAFFSVTICVICGLSFS
jgi:hypothetical protein